MAARPCPTNLCVCPGVDSPITNTSAEAPDPLLFWGQIWNPYNPWKNPPLGNGQYTKQDCSTDIQEFFTNIDPIIYANTQLLASLQALAAELGCEWPQTGDLTYTNDEQTATVYCPDGTAFTYTVAAGTITASFSDAELGEAFHVYANAWAAAYAYQQASAMMDCITPDPDIPPDPGPTKPRFPSGPGFTDNPSWMCLGGEYVDNYTISGRSNGSYIIEIVGGAIPPGTAFTQNSPNTASISGFPVAAGEYTWTIRATSLTAPTVTLQVQDSLWVMGITNDVLPDAQATNPYSEQLLATGGTAPYTFALDSGSSLPNGLTLATDGTISGTPTTNGDYTFAIVITDDNAGECIQNVSLSVNTSFDCGVTPSSIQDAIWTPLFYRGPCTTGSIVNGVCTSWAIYQVLQIADPCWNSSNGLVWQTTICNPGPSYDVTVSAPFASFGFMFLPPAPDPTMVLTLIVDWLQPGEYYVDSIPSWLVTYGGHLADDPNPIVATISLPAFSTFTLTIRLLSNAVPAGANGYWIQSTGNLTVLPLTPP